MFKSTGLLVIGTEGIKVVMKLGGKKVIEKPHMVGVSICWFPFLA